MFYLICRSVISAGEVKKSLATRDNKGEQLVFSLVHKYALVTVKDLSCCHYLRVVGFLQRVVATIIL